MSDRDNIVLVTVDSLRTDYCGYVTDKGSCTPALDRLAEDGLVFENAIAPGPATLGSMPVVFSGEYYPRPDPEASVPEKRSAIRDHMNARETIPNLMSRRGYETAAFTTNPWTTRRSGFDDGFDHFEDFMDVDRSEGRLDRLLDRFGDGAGEGIAADVLDLVSKWKQQNIMFQSWETFYDDIIEWTRHAEEPYFLWVFLVDTHMPYLPKENFASQSALTTYAANLWLYLGSERFESLFRDPLLTAYEDTVRYTDTFLERLTDDLAADDPVYVVHSDHGEEFGEQGVYGHGTHLSEELIRTPLVVGNGPSGRVDQLFSLSDMPSLLERLADGEDVDDLPEPVVHTRNMDPLSAARGDGWKYVTDGNEETLYRVPDGHNQFEIWDSDLLETARDLVAHWESDEAERREIARAADKLADDSRV